MKFIDRIASSIILPRAFGLDFSDYTMKFVSMRQSISGGLSIDSFGEVELPDGIIAGGEIKKEKELVALIREPLKAADGTFFRGRFVSATLPEEKSFVRVIQLPKMNSEDVAKAARWELEGALPIPADQVIFDYAALPLAEKSQDHMDLLITAFPKSIVESYAGVFGQAGLIPVALELESQAIVRALWGGERDAILYVDFGAARTSIITVVAGFILFTRTVALGGRDIERAIASCAHVSKEEARRIKIDEGFSKEYKEGVLIEALLPLLSAFADELKKQVLFYREHSAHRHGMPEDISTVVLTGGDANLFGLSNYLSVTLKKEVRTGDSMARLFQAKHFYPPFSRNVSLKYSTAIGAALRGVGM